MPCINYGNAIVCNGVIGTYRLRLDDGGYIFMDWHNYFGPFFYHDRQCSNEVAEWYENESIVRAFNWFQHRGNKA